MFDGGRWHSDGPAQSFSPDRFEPMGEYAAGGIEMGSKRQLGDIWCRS
jgi:hypothetical protein